MKSNHVIVIISLVGLVLTGVVSAASNEADRDGMPDNHRSGWVEKHQHYAKGDSKNCMQCHKPMDCIDCHTRRDDITQRVHKRNWKFYHGVEARANPRRCDSCHQQQFCTDCHRNPR